MKINITRLEKLLEHYRSFYYFTVMWAFMTVFLMYIDNVDRFDAKVDALVFLLFVWFNYRKVQKIEKESKQYEMMFENIDDTKTDEA